MTRKKQPASNLSPMSESPAPKPRPTQRQNGGRKPDPNKGIPITVKLPPALHARLVAKIKASRWNRTAIVREALDRYLPGIGS